MMVIVIKNLCKKVLAKIKPTKKELLKEEKIAHRLIERIRNIEGKQTEVMLAGSMARGTHLRGDRDIDIFILFPEKMDRKQFVKEGLRIGKKVFKGHFWEEAYTEHPYIRGNINGFDIEVVPSYKVSKADLLKSAVDRSPFHNEYLQGRLSRKQKDEVRLLKQFLKGIRCYGADLRVSSMSGYVTELLVLKYGSFDKCMEAVAKWRKGEVIDLEKHYSSAEDVRKKFDSPLIIVDPVDKNRNVAAALSLTQFSRFIAAARAFLKRPSENFFFGKREKPWSGKKLREMLKKKELVALQLAYPKNIIPDIMWGQLRRFRKKLANQIVREDFVVVRSDEWIEEGKIMVVLIELESLILQKAAKRIGPEVADERNSNLFLKAHKNVISGPRIERGRWVIEIGRKYTDVRAFLKDYLKKAKRIEKENLRKALGKAKILNETDIIRLYNKNEEFQQFLTIYLKGGELFLDY